MRVDALGNYFRAKASYLCLGFIMREIWAFLAKGEWLKSGRGALEAPKVTSVKWIIVLITVGYLYFLNCQIKLLNFFLFGPEEQLECM